MIKYLHLEGQKTIYTMLFIIVIQQSISIKKRNEFIYSNYPHDYEHFLKKSIKKKRNTVKLFEECIKDNYNNEFTIINYLNEVMKNNTYFE